MKLFKENNLKKSNLKLRIVVLMLITMLANYFAILTEFTGVVFASNGDLSSFINVDDENQEDSTAEETEKEEENTEEKEEDQTSEEVKDDEESKLEDENVTEEETKETSEIIDSSLEILNAVDVNNAFENIGVIREILMGKGYENIENETLLAETSTQLVDIMAYFKAIEENLTALNSTDYTSIYYGEEKKVEAGAVAHNTQEIFRWFQILNDMLEMVRDLSPKWSILTTIDGFPTIDGKRIIVKGE